MPTCLSHCLQFLCFHSPRSRSPEPHLGGPRDATGARHSNSPGLVPTPASLSHPSFPLGVTERDVNAATGTSPSLATQIVAGHLLDEVPDDFTGQPTRASLSATPADVVLPNSVSRRGSVLL
jgi:hypothetical protein